MNGAPFLLLFVAFEFPFPSIKFPPFSSSICGRPGGGTDRSPDDQKTTPLLEMALLYYSQYFCL